MATKRGKTGSKPSKRMKNLRLSESAAKRIKGGSSTGTGGAGAGHVKFIELTTK